MSEKLVPEVNDTTRLYWEGTAQGELRIKHCSNCDAVFRFNHAWCPICGELEIGWRAASGRGVVENFSIIHAAPYEAYANDVPYVLALIELEEGVRVTTNIVGCDPHSVRVGMAVNLTFETRGEIQLPQFEPRS